MYYQLFVDDLRFPFEVKWIPMPLGTWMIVRDYDEFVDAITEYGLPALISFDHDLGLEHYPCSEPDGGIGQPNKIPYDSYKEKTGFHCAKWLVDYCLDKNQKLPHYQVHSLNAIGADNILSLLDSFKRSQDIRPL